MRFRADVAIMQSRQVVAKHGRGGAGKSLGVRQSKRAANSSKPSMTAICGWNEGANYCSRLIDSMENMGMAWYYAVAKPAARTVGGRLALRRVVTAEPWRGVERGRAE